MCTPIPHSKRIKHLNIMYMPYFCSFLSLYHGCSISSCPKVGADALCTWNLAHKLNGHPRSSSLSHIIENGILITYFNSKCVHFYVKNVVSYAHRLAAYMGKQHVPKSYILPQNLYCFLMKQA